MGTLHHVKTPVFLLALCIVMNSVSCSDFLIEVKEDFIPSEKPAPYSDEYVSGLTVSPMDAMLAVGKTLQLEIQITPDTAGISAISLSSSDPSVPTVSSTGLITGIKEGYSSINVIPNNGSVSAICSVQVRKNVDIDMVSVAGGTFNNGTADMTVSSFSIGKYEVTQKQYLDLMFVMGPSTSSPLKFGAGDNYPVYSVNWDDAVRFCNALSRLYGYEEAYTIQSTGYAVDITREGFRLPTEAEWEFAARGGNESHGYDYSGSNTVDDVTWYNVNSSSSVHAVGGKGANELGLYDMSGNVSEWCNDFYDPYPMDTQTDYIGPSTGSERVLRGGGWSSDLMNCTVVTRDHSYTTSSGDYGFRVVRSADTGLAVNGISVSQTSKNLFVGANVQLIATVSPVRAKDRNVNWTCSNTSVATVSPSGFVVGVSPGTATITLTTNDGGFAANCAVTVLALSSAIVDMVSVPGGSFTIPGMYNHSVTVSSFAIGKYEITQKQYKDMIGNIPSTCTSTYGYGDKYPVYNVSWYDAVSFCNALSLKEGYECVYIIDGTTVGIDFSKNGYRLPTEMEWMFAARGGNGTHNYSYAGSNSIDNVAWYYGNASSTAHVVGGKASNELVLYDMSGNVSEWCNDLFGPYPSGTVTDYRGATTGTNRIACGGGWNNTYSMDCSVTSRVEYAPSMSEGYIGFRVVRVP